VTALLSDYIVARSKHKHADSPALWLGERERLTATGVRRLLKVRAEQAGLDLGAVYAHVFRYGIVDHLLGEEVPETLIAAVTGHADTRMIKHYARARAERLAGATLARHSLIDTLLSDSNRDFDTPRLLVVGP